MSKLKTFGTFCRHDNEFGNFSNKLSPAEKSCD